MSTASNFHCATSVLAIEANNIIGHTIAVIVVCIADQSEASASQLPDLIEPVRYGEEALCFVL